MDVKRVFFEGNSNLPSFELENGDIKRPKVNGTAVPRWFTDKEHEKYLEKNTPPQTFFQKLLNL